MVTGTRHGSEVAVVRRLMDAFAERTGLVDHDGTPTRYLWTDAFALCNFLELARRTGEAGYERAAIRLAGQVHHVLGRHRPDGRLSGWLSGLSEGEGERHPTLGGLRIGKERPERLPGEPFDERAEWDRDGQYLHYLTRWMHALARLTRSTGDPTYARWAVEMAHVVYHAFRYLGPAGRPRLYWKMSLDLSRPLVRSMGQHDALDTLVTFLELDWVSSHRRELENLESLAGPIAELSEMASRTALETSDPLGIGGLLIEAYRVAQLGASGVLPAASLLEPLVDACESSLRFRLRGAVLIAPAAERLAFRELGLAIGLRSIPPMRNLVESNADVLDSGGVSGRRLAALSDLVELADRVETFWLEEENRRSPSWIAHQDINSVMLATSLAPDAFLEI